MSEIKAYTLEEVEKILKVTRRTIYNYIKAGKLKAHKMGKSWRVSEQALKSLVYGDEGTPYTQGKKLDVIEL